MNNQINSSNNSFLLQSAVGADGGLHASNSWLQRGVDLFKEGLTVDITDTGFNYHYKGESFHLSNSQTVQATLFEALKLASKDSDAIRVALTMMSQGFGSTAQQTFKIPATTRLAKSDALVTTKINLSALEYKESCIKLALDSKNVAAVSQLLDEVGSLTDKDTKAALIELLGKFSSIFVSDTQHRLYSIKAEDERVAAIKFKALIDNNFTDIRALSSGSYVGILALSDLASVGLLAGLGYSMTATIPLPDGSFQIAFKDTLESNPKNVQ